MNYIRAFLFNGVQQKIQFQMHALVRYLYDVAINVVFISFRLIKSFKKVLHRITTLRLILTLFS